MSLLKLSPVPEGSRWPSGEGVDLALLPMNEQELSARLGLPLVRGFEPGLGPWSAIAGRLPSGVAVEFICYEKKPAPKGVVFRADKGVAYSAALDEALQLVRVSRNDLTYVSPEAA